MTEDQDNQTAESPVMGFFKENKIGVAVGSVLLIAAVIYTATLGGGSAEPTAVPTVSSTAQLGPGTASPSASPSATPRPTGTGNPSSDPEASEDPSEDPSEGSGNAPSGKPTSKPAKETGAGNQTKGTDGTVVGNHAQTPDIQAWESFAEEFSVAWADTSGGKDAWLKRLDPLITEELHDSFTYTDIRALFDDTFVQIIADQEDKAAYKIFTAEYEENGALFQGLIALQPDGSWKVDTIAPPEE